MSSVGACGTPRKRSFFSSLNHSQPPSTRSTSRSSPLALPRLSLAGPDTARARELAFLLGVGVFLSSWEIGVLEVIGHQLDEMVMLGEVTRSASA